MKKYLIPVLALLPFSLPYAAKANTVTTVPSNIATVDTFTSTADTLKKVFSAKDWSQLEKKLRKEMPKKMAKVMIKQLQSVASTTESLTDVKSFSKLTMKGDSFSDEMETAFDELDYEMERKEIIDEFKKTSYENSAERREARKEMKEDLKELKKDYKKSKNND